MVDFKKLMEKKRGERSVAQNTTRGTMTLEQLFDVGTPSVSVVPVGLKCSAFHSTKPDILLANRSHKCRMTWKDAAELAFLCGAVEQDNTVIFELMHDTRFADRTNNTLLIRKQFGKFTHYVQPMHRQEEIILWQKKLNLE